MVSNEQILRYFAVSGLQVSKLQNADLDYLYQRGSTLGFNLLDGQRIVYFGLFDRETPKEIIFRIKLLLQNLHQAREEYKRIEKGLSPQQQEHYKRGWENMSVEVFVSKEVDKQKIQTRVEQLTTAFTPIQWRLLDENDIKARIEAEYALIGDV